MLTEIHEILSLIENRNVMRASSGLPLLDVKKEMEAILHHDRIMAEDALRSRVTTDCGERVIAKMLHRERVRRGDPGWAPRGSVFNGNPNFFHALRQRMDRLHHRINRRELALIDENYARLEQQMKMLWVDARESMG